MIPFSLYGGVCQCVFISTLLNYPTLVTCIQTWYYYGRYPSDPWYIKLLVSLRESPLLALTRSCATGRWRSRVRHLPPSFDHTLRQVQSSTTATRVFIHSQCTHISSPTSERLQPLGILSGKSTPAHKVLVLIPHQESDCKSSFP